MEKEKESLNYTMKGKQAFGTTDNQYNSRQIQNQMDQPQNSPEKVAASQSTEYSLISQIRSQFTSYQIINQFSASQLKNESTPHLLNR